MWLALLFACSSPAPTPAPDAPPPPATQAGTPHDGTPRPRIPAGSTALPPDLVCPEGRRGGLGCYRQLSGGRVLLGAQATNPAGAAYDASAEPNEAPLTTAEVDPFWIRSWVVSAGEFSLCLASGWCDADTAFVESPLATIGDPDRSMMPAVGITWQGAQRFCAWFDGRLPTEAEWAYAARGTEGRRWPWGNEPKCPQRQPGSDARTSGTDLSQVDETLCMPVIERLRAHLGEVAFEELTGPMQSLLPTDTVEQLCKTLAEAPGPDIVVAIRSAMATAKEGRQDIRCLYDGPIAMGDEREGTPEGVFGLGGNVWEWTADLYGPHGGPPEGTKRVQRGGSYMSEDPVAWRSAVRGGMDPDAKLPDVGFRCVWTGDRHD